MKIRLQIVLSIVLVMVTACQSDSKMSGGSSSSDTFIIPDRDSESTADGAAYTADSMHPRQPMPSRPDWRPTEFYFKECSEIGDQVYYSKTSYHCAER